MVVIDCIADLHGFKPKLTGGDLLIVAGDLTARDTLAEHIMVTDWMHAQDYKRVIFIAGNHDGFINAYPSRCDHVYYLCDSGTEFEGFKIWGSPYTPWFEGVNPKCAAFMCNRGEDIKKHWDKIPNDTDILVTHGPPYKMLDCTVQGKRVGCEELRKRVLFLGTEKLKLHVFGHVHEEFGCVDAETPNFVNCSYVNELYKPVNKPVRIEL